MKKQRWTLAGALFLLSACADNFFYGKSNFPEPRPLEASANVQLVRNLWQHKLGKGQHELQQTLQVAQANGVLYAVSTDGRLYALDPQTGAVHWQRALNNTITAGVSALGGVLFVGTANGNLLALNAENGLPIWHASLSSQLLAKPAVGGDMVVVRTLDGQISAYKALTGEHLWQYHSASPALSMRGQSAPIIAGGIVLVMGDNGRFLILDQDSGVPFVEERVAVGKGRNAAQRMVDIDAQPQLVQDLLLASAYQSGVMAFDVRAGKMVWQQDIASALRDFAIVGQEVMVFADDRGQLYGLSVRDGKPLWHVTELEGRKLSAVAALNARQVAVLDFEGYLHVFDALSGSALGYQKIADGGADAAPVRVGDTLLWQLNDGRLIALQP